MLDPSQYPGWDTLEEHWLTHNDVTYHVVSGTVTEGTLKTERGIVRINGRSPWRFDGAIHEALYRKVFPK